MAFAASRMAAARLSRQIVHQLPQLPSCRPARVTSINYSAVAGMACVASAMCTSMTTAECNNDNSIVTEDDEYMEGIKLYGIGIKDVSARASSAAADCHVQDPVSAPL